MGVFIPIKSNQVRNISLLITLLITIDIKEIGLLLTLDILLITLPPLVTLMDLSRDLVFDLYNSEDLFPIDFDDAWHWIGWTAKRTGKDLLEANFFEDLDFLRKGSKSPNGGRPSEWIVLTVDCFKSLAMMAGTAQGRRVRAYFLGCEKELKQHLEVEKQNHNHRVLQAYITRDKLPWERKFESEYYRQIHRLRGWSYDPSTSKRTPLLGHITNEIVYKRLQPGILEELRALNPILPSGRRRYRHHEFLTNNIGNPHLKSHLSKLIMLMSGCSNWKSFLSVLDRFMPIPGNVQADIFFDLFEMGEIEFEEWERLVS